MGGQVDRTHHARVPGKNSTFHTHVPLDGESQELLDYLQQTGRFENDNFFEAFTQCQRWLVNYGIYMESPYVIGPAMTRSLPDVCRS